MITQPAGILGVLLVASGFALSVVPAARAHGGGHGGHGGGHSGGGGGGGGGGMRAPHFSGAMPAFKAPRMAHSATPARVNSGRQNSRAMNSQAHTNNTTGLTNSNTTGLTNNNATGLTNNHQSQANRAQSLGGSQSLGGNQSLASNRSVHTNLGAASTTGIGSVPASSMLTTPLNTTRGMMTGVSPSTYTYGSGNGARNYRAYGYGNGYRNRRYGGGYGYGRSQGNNRAVVARLRSVHASLATNNHDYQGHRVRAMQAVSMAIRQLSHRSMIASGAGFSGMNTGRAMGMRQQGGAGAGGGMGGRRGQPMSQAQSDARMSRDLRTLQGINMQLASQGNTTGHARASGHVQQAMHEINFALSIR
jgi:hypothetical protein